MGKILIFVSIVVTLLSAGLGFVNKGKLTEANDKVTAAEAQAASTKTELAAAKKAGDETAKSLATVTAEKDTLATQITTVKADLDKANTDLTAATAAKTTAETDLAAAKTELEKAKADLATAQSNPVAPQVDESAALKAQVAEQEAVVAELQKKLDQANTDRAALVKDKQDRAAGLMRPGQEGRILAVNPAWNFVVLNIGDKNNVANNAELLVKRGNQLIGKVRITSVEPSTSIADIVANSVPSGTSIAPGDHVIYQIEQ